MAKSKLSELTAATQVNKADAMYLVQSGVSKQVSTSILFAGITDPTIKGNIVLGGTPQDMTSASIVNITTPITYLGVGSSQSTISIPNDASGRVIFLPRLKMEYPAGRYISDLELTDLLGAVETPFNIDWELTQDRTN